MYFLTNENGDKYFLQNKIGQAYISDIIGLNNNQAADLVQSETFKIVTKTNFNMPDITFAFKFVNPPYAEYEKFHQYLLLAKKLFFNKEIVLEGQKTTYTCAVKINQLNRDEFKRNLTLQVSLNKLTMWQSDKKYQITLNNEFQLKNSVPTPFFIEFDFISIFEFPVGYVEIIFIQESRTSTIKINHPFTFRNQTNVKINTGILGIENTYFLLDDINSYHLLDFSRDTFFQLIGNEKTTIQIRSGPSNGQITIKEISIYENRLII